MVRVFRWLLSLNPAWLLLPVLMTTLATTTFLRAKLDRAHNEITALQFDAVNAAALHDSLTRELTDSLATARKLIVQVKPRADTAVTARIVAAIAPLIDTVESLPEAYPDTGQRQYRFNVEQYPFYGHAAVRVTSDGASAQLALQLAVEQARLRAAIRCIPAEKPGVRAAQLAVQGPPWLVIDSLEVRQDPVVCNAPVLFTKQKRGWRVPVKWVPVAALVGYLIAKGVK